jgi:TPR repeat protein
VPLGQMYRKGLGVPKNYAAAWRLIKNAAMPWSAAKQGNSHAQMMIGVLYSNGQGDKQNLPEAAKWFELAAKKGEAGAQFSQQLALCTKLSLRTPKATTRPRSACLRWVRPMGRASRLSVGVPAIFDGPAIWMILRSVSSCLSVSRVRSSTGGRRSVCATASARN